eukprot:239805-Rhodomonas_salina.1
MLIPGRWARVGRCTLTFNVRCTAHKPHASQHPPQTSPQRQVERTCAGARLKLVLVRARARAIPER